MRIGYIIAAILAATCISAYAGSIVPIPPGTNVLNGTGNGMGGSIVPNCADCFPMIPYSPSAGGGAQPTGDILLADGTSLILQTDAASFICRAGGC